ncbi:protein FAM186A-like [Dermacentor albipictus]|uniref:protein FAM186A-like n=1 Tax=Dermacentor albipictus TaxID=60249 RepID=UPI0038FD0AD6
MRSSRKEPLLLTVMWHLGWHLVPHQFAPCHCPIYEAAVVPNWTQFSGLEWYEVLNNPGPLEKCVVRKYDVDNQTMKWIEQNGPYGDAARTKKFDFVVEGSQQFLKKDKSFFQQILDTDLHTWALLHICSQGDGKSKLALTFRDPLSVIPADITARVSQTLQKVGISGTTKWTRSPCAIDRTLRLEPAPPGPVVMFPSPEAVAPFDRPQVTDEANGTGTTQQQGDAPPKNDGALETAMSHVTILPQGTEQSRYTDKPQGMGTPLQSGTPQQAEEQHVTILPQETEQGRYTDKPQEMGTPLQSGTPQQAEEQPVTILPQETEQSRYTDKPQEMGTPLQSGTPQQAEEQPVTILPQETEQSRYTDKPQETGTPLQSGTPQQAEEQHVTIPPQGTDQHQFPPDKPQEMGRPQEAVLAQTEAASKAPLVGIVTTTWVPYTNDEESW